MLGEKDKEKEGGDFNEAPSLFCGKEFKMYITSKNATDFLYQRVSIQV